MNDNDMIVILVIWALATVAVCAGIDMTGSLLALLSYLPAVVVSCWITLE